MIVRTCDAPTESLLTGHQCYDWYLLWFQINETRLVVDTMNRSKNPMDSATL
jgi:hypothetical protein